MAISLAGAQTMTTQIHVRLMSCSGQRSRAVVKVPAFAVCQITVVHSRKLHPDPKANSKHGTFHCLRKESVNATLMGRNFEDL